MNSYYEDLADSSDKAKRVGWRHRIEQAYRFEAALEALPGSSDDAPARPRVLDIGCGLGAFADYLEACEIDHDWVGLEREESFLASLDEERTALRADYTSVTFDELDFARRFDAVVAVGALSGAYPNGQARDPLEALERLVEFASAASDRACVVALDAGRIAERASMAVEPALGAVSPFGAWAIVRRSFEHSLVVHISTTDFAVFGWSGDSPEIRDVPRRLSATLDGPWGRDEPASRRAWLACEVGEYRRAARLLGSKGELDDLGRVVSDRLTLLS